MLSFPGSVHIYLAPGHTDMRKAFDGLAAIARDIIEVDPLSGHVFAFCNRRRDRVKILVWDRDGFWLFAKRLEKGTFRWPDGASDGRRIEMKSAELNALLGGLDIANVKRRKRWDYLSNNAQD